MSKKSFTLYNKQTTMRRSESFDSQSSLSRKKRKTQSRNHKNVQFTSQKKQFQRLKLFTKCPYGGSWSHCCTDDNCEKSAIICSSLDCLCRTEHKKCFKEQASDIVKQAFRKKLELGSNSWINKLKQQTKNFQRFVSDLQERMKLSSLGKHEANLIFMLKTQGSSISSLSGSQMHKALWELQNGDRNKSEIEKAERELISSIPDARLTQMKATLEDMMSILDRRIASVPRKIAEEASQSKRENKDNSKLSEKQCSEPLSINIKKEQPNELKKNWVDISRSSKRQCQVAKESSQILNQMKQPEMVQDLIEDSAILKTKDQQIFINSLFRGQKKPIGFKRIFRASSKGFSTKQFRKDCHNIPNTILLIETSHGKVIGGFTPVSWKVDKDGYEEDQTGQSVLFSVTHQEKIPLKPQKAAVYQAKDMGPWFGNPQGNDLLIFDKADSNEESYANIGNSFESNNYKKMDRNSWERFTGSGVNYHLKAKEWEVYEVLFEK